MLRDVANVLAAGVFIQAEVEGNCTFCDFAPVCSGKPWKGHQRKFHDAGNPVLDVVRRMRRHDVSSDGLPPTRR